MSDSTRAKLAAAEAHLVAEGFLAVETDPPGIILHEEYHIIRAVGPEGEHRFLGLHKQWLASQPSGAEVVELLERKGVALTLKRGTREIYIVDNQTLRGLDA